MEISIWLAIALFVSVVLNVMFFALLRDQSSKLSVIADNSSDLIDMIDSFKEHVKAVYSLESFYGDETLEGLMNHARALRLILDEQYSDIAALAVQIEYEEEEEAENAEKEEKEQHVFYAGTRRSDN